jgi:hypothetical protein
MTIAFIVLVILDLFKDASNGSGHVASLPRSVARKEVAMA